MKFCILLRIYLRILKKSSTFAVPINEALDGQPLDS